MKLFSLVMLMSGMLVVNGSYASEKQISPRRLMFGDEYKNGQLKEIKVFNQNEEVSKSGLSLNEEQEDWYGQYNETGLKSWEITLKSWGAACFVSTAYMLWLFQEPLSKAADEYTKKNN